MLVSRRHLRILAGAAAIDLRQCIEDDASAMADQVQVVPPPPKNEIQMLKVPVGSRLLHEQCFGTAGEDVQTASGQNGSVNADKENQESWTWCVYVTSGVCWSNLGCDGGSHSHRNLQGEHSQR